MSVIPKTQREMKMGCSTYQEAVDHEQKQSREQRRLTLIAKVLRDFIKELTSYNPRVLVRVIKLVISRKHITSLGRAHEVHLPCVQINYSLVLAAFCNIWTIDHVPGSSSWFCIFVQISDLLWMIMSFPESNYCYLDIYLKCNAMCERLRIVAILFVTYKC